MSEKIFKGTIEQIAEKYGLECLVRGREVCFVVPYDRKDISVVCGCEEGINGFDNRICCAPPKRKITIKIDNG